MNCLALLPFLGYHPMDTVIYEWFPYENGHILYDIYKTSLNGHQLITGESITRQLTYTVTAFLHDYDLIEPNLQGDCTIFPDMAFC